MPKWKSAAQIEQERLDQLIRDAYPLIKPLMESYVNSYDPNQPIEDNMRNYATYPVSLMEQRLSKAVVWQYMKDHHAAETNSTRAWMASQCLEKFMKPYRDEERAQSRERQKQLKAALAQRDVVFTDMYEQSINLGEYVYIKELRAPLICTDCWYSPPSTDYGTFPGGYSVSFANPTDEEKRSPEYLAEVARHTTS